MERFEYLSDFKGAIGDEQVQLVQRWPDMKWLIRAYDLPKVRTVSGLCCWVVMENRSLPFMQSLLREFGDRIRGFLFRVPLCNWMNESRDIAHFLMETKPLMEEQSVKMGLYVETSLRDQPLEEPQWIYYWHYLDMVVIRSDAIWDPYGVQHFNLYSTLMIMGIPSHIIIVPFQLPFILPLDRYNLKGWYIPPASRSVYQFHTPLPTLCHR